MKKNERAFIALILVIIIVLVGFDLATDSGEGVKWWHLLSEGLVAIAAVVGIFFLMRGSLVLKHNLEDERQQSAQFRIEAETWRAEAKKYLLGLSQAIDDQLVNWKLTVSEKEVAFLLLKGLSLKEIAEVRSTTEKTARAQSTAIYAKSNLAGRSELAAFFLEDLLLPADSKNEGI
ncbi:MAG: helix-turn-helix transcriptional regulator [Pseudobdellovibrio sp.]